MTVGAAAAVVAPVVGGYGADLVTIPPKTSQQ